MGILDQINERNTIAQGTADQQIAEANKETAEQNSGGDAVQQSAERRQNHKQAFINTADPDESLIIDEPAGPEEQEVHEKMERRVLEIVNTQNKGGTQALLKALNSGEDAVHGIGMVTSDIVQVLKEENPTATQDVLFSIGEFLVVQLQELMEISDPRIQLSDEDLGEAVAIAMEDFMATNKTEIDDDEVRGFLAE